MTSKTVLAQPDPLILIINVIVLVWIMGIVGLALWKAARNEEKYWFVGIFLSGFFTYGIIPVLYLFIFAKHKMKLRDLIFWKKN